MNKSVLVLLVLFTGISALVLQSNESDEIFHSELERSYFKSVLTHDSTLVDGWNDLFAASGECNGCHGSDPAEVASVDDNGLDINVVDSWRATMMANSAKDPFWRAKVSHEVLVSPAHQLDIESSCTDCHAPMGFYNAMHLGLPHYTMEDLRMDSVALDGVSCGPCHQLSPDSIGLVFSGQGFQYDVDTIYGQYEDPFAGPMQSFVGFAPVYSAHIEKSEVCAGCHTLITETIGLDGTLNGNEFVEQATYHEWVNSAYNVEDESAQECQSCHMTRVDDDIIIAANLLFLPPRTPFYKHDIVGGNSFMVDLMKENRDTLDLRASGALFDSVKAATLDMLQNNTLDLLMTELNRTDDTLFLDLELTNKAGHKFPSGYPSRIAYVQLIAVAESGDTLFKSGMLDEEFELINRDPIYEQHYDVINSEEQVQIYELVFADENGTETTVLSQGDITLKDNRLVPFGFTNAHYTYDTVSYYGQVLIDDDFNLDELNNQGTGKDNVEFQIFLDGYQGNVSVYSKVFYQVTPPRWLAMMFDHNSEDIDLFRWMYENSDKDPVEVASELLVSTVSGIQEIENTTELVLYPNPNYTGEIAVLNKAGRSIDAIEVWDSLGKMIQSKKVRGNIIYVQLPETTGLYFVHVYSGGTESIMQVLRY